MGWESLPRCGRAEPTAEADRGRHPGFPSFNVLAGGPGSLALAVRRVTASFDPRATREEVSMRLLGHRTYQGGHATHRRKPTEPEPVRKGRVRRSRFVSCRSRPGRHGEGGRAGTPVSNL